MRALTVGLTGGLASGKSTLGRWMGDAGFHVIDADQVVADLYRPAGPGARAVAELFGDQVLDQNGAVDHLRLADRVFADGLARRRLEEAIHPLVRDHFRNFAESVIGVAVLEVPLLVESGMAADFDLIVTVEAPIDVRVARAVERGLDAEQARARVAAQSSESVRRAAADLEIENDSDLETFRSRADALIEQIREQAQSDA
jgi:dephospho-CoA kinase